MSKSTIINHLRILKEEDGELNLAKFLPDASTLSRIKEALVKIKERNTPDDFSEDEKTRLKPIYELLDGEVSYDDIRITLL